MDVSRGDMICRPHNQPPAAREFEAMVCWMADQRAQAPRGRYAIKHTTRERARDRAGPALPDRRQHAAPRRGGHDARAQRHRPRAPQDQRRRCSSTSTAATAATGSFILIDEATNETVGAGMIPGARVAEAAAPGRERLAGRRGVGREAGRSPDVIWHAGALRARGALGSSSAPPARRSGSPACPASGKSTIAVGVEERAAGRRAGPPTCSTATTCATA